MCMRLKARKRYFLLGVLFVILLILFCLKTYSENLRHEATFEMWDIKTRNIAIQKYNLAQVIWPPLWFNPDYKNLVNNFETKPSIVVFVRNETGNGEVDGLVAELKAIKGVTNVTFLSADEAMKIYVERNKNEPLLLQSVSKDFFPASIDIYMNDFSHVEEINAILKVKPFVEKIIPKL